MSPAVDLDRDHRCKVLLRDVRQQLGEAEREVDWAQEELTLVAMRHAFGEAQEADVVEVEERLDTAQRRVRRLNAMIKGLKDEGGIITFAGT